MTVQTSVQTEVIHTVTVSAPEGDHFVVSQGDGQAITDKISVTVHTDEHGTLRTVGTGWTARGRTLTDGKPVGREHHLHGTNLTRLPAEAVVAVQQALASLDLDDPNRQLFFLAANRA